MLAVSDLDHQLPRKTFQLVCAGVRNHCDGELPFAARHRGAVLKDESSFAPLEGAADFLDRDVTCRTFGDVPAGQHLTFARAFDIAMPLLLDRHAPKRLIIRLVVLWVSLYFKCSGRVIGHRCSLLSRFVLLDFYAAGDRLVGKNTQSTFHDVAFDGELPPETISGSLSFGGQRLFARVILEIDDAHRFRLAVYDLVGGDLHAIIFTARRRDVINHLFIMTAWIISHANGLAGPIAEERRSLLALHNAKAQREIDTGDDYGNSARFGNSQSNNLTG